MDTCPNEIQRSYSKKEGKTDHSYSELVLVVLLLMALLLMLVLAVAGNISARSGAHSLLAVLLGVLVVLVALVLLLPLVALPPAHASPRRGRQDSYCWTRCRQNKELKALKIKRKEKCPGMWGLMTNHRMSEVASTLHSAVVLVQVWPVSDELHHCIQCNVRPWLLEQLLSYLIMTLQWANSWISTQSKVQHAF